MREKRRRAAEGARMGMAGADPPQEEEAGPSTFRHGAALHGGLADYRPRFVGGKQAPPAPPLPLRLRLLLMS